MKNLAILIVLAGCGQREPATTHESKATRAADAAVAAPSSGYYAEITFLTAMDELPARIPQSQQEAFGTAVQSIWDGVAAHDRAHPGTLPDPLYVYIAIATERRLKVALTTTNGDADAGDLPAALARVPAPLLSGSVAVVVVLTRDKRSIDPSEVIAALPAEWRAAAGAGGASTDELLTRLWAPGSP